MAEPATASPTLTFANPTHFRALLGNHDEHIRLLERALGVRIDVGEGTLAVSGDAIEAELAGRVLEQLYGLIEQGYPIYASDVEYALRILSSDHTARLRDIFLDTVFISATRRTITPKSVAQKAYIDAIRNFDIVFGVGPAGTGKTYLAMAMAVAELMKNNFTRIVLCRPAVEAGEKLGFLPGDLAEKVNPYLRPLYDALNDMVDFDRARKLIERGTIEVAPLAFMRGRAQPVTSQVLTRLGWKPIGEIEPGDYVIGSDGRATQVLGVYPQGQKDVFRVTATDGASTRCCGDHLWSVQTLEDRRRSKGFRVETTRDMIGRLQRAHQNRFELPMLGAPVEFAAEDVPLEPYALGLLLGDGCLTGSTTPTFATADVELRYALEISLGEGIEVAHKGGVDYVLRNRFAGRGGLRIPNPVTVVARELGLCGTHSDTKFVPPVYLWNSTKVRLAVLQGLLDSDGGPVLQDGRSCRIQYTTTSAQLRDDVVFLVRSLGGVAYWRTRAAEGRKPGRARGRNVGYRSDAYVLDIRLPAVIAPFRLGRKAFDYENAGGGRPMRFIRSIEPDGVEDCVCIRVAAPDSLYVTDDFILTHNTLNDSFVILDEAQNTTSEQMKMFLTRLGYGSKAVVTGDVTQIDLPAGKQSGLKEAQVLLRGIEGIRIVTFTERDVVRHPLVQEIIGAYDRSER